MFNLSLSCSHCEAVIELTGCLNEPSNNMTNSRILSREICVDETGHDAVVVQFVEVTEEDVVVDDDMAVVEDDDVDVVVEFSVELTAIF